LANVKIRILQRDQPEALLAGTDVTSSSDP